MPTVAVEGQRFGAETVDASPDILILVRRAPAWAEVTADLGRERG